MYPANDMESVEWMASRLHAWRRVQSRRMAAGAGAAGFLFVAAAAVASGCIPGAAAGAAAMYVGCALAMGWVNRAVGEQEALVRRLAACDDVRVVGPLLEEMLNADRESDGAAVAALARLLPRLREDDERLLTPRQRDLFAELLYLHDNPVLLIALIQALRYVGDTGARHRIRMLAAGAVPWMTDLRVREAAREALPHVLARAAREEAARRGSSLLRPAVSPSSDPAALPRPASGTRRDDHDILLRPREPDDRRKAA